LTREEAEKKCYELIHEALRIAREYDPEIHRISCYIIDDRPDGSCYTNVHAMKRGEGVDEEGYENTINVLDYSKFDYSTDKGEQA
jgi:hypothetical protein